jgi:hypothetical protein
MNEVSREKQEEGRKMGVRKEWEGEAWMGGGQKLVECLLYARCFSTFILTSGKNI